MTTSRADSGLPGRVLTSHELTRWRQGVGPGPGADLAGLASLSVIGAAIRRRALLCGMTAVAGTLLGAGLYFMAPPQAQASTSVLLTQNPQVDPENAAQAEVALAQTRSVAQPVLRSLGLRESVGAFIASYSVVALTDRVLVITVSAPSSAQAVRRSAALAARFLWFHASELAIQQQLANSSLVPRIGQADRRVAVIDAAMSRVVALPAGPPRRRAVSRLLAQRAGATLALARLAKDEASSQATTAAMIAGSGVLDAAAPLPLPRRLRVIYAVDGLIAGLQSALLLVAIGALTTDRPRRRQDVALALGAPVRLSVSLACSRRAFPLASGRLEGATFPRKHRSSVLAQGDDPLEPPRFQRGAAPFGSLALGSPSARSRRAFPLPLPHVARSRGADVRKIVAYLRDVVERAPGDGIAALAVVTVCPARLRGFFGLFGSSRALSPSVRSRNRAASVAGLSVASLATSLAREGKRVLVADLINGCPVGRLLGVTSPGVHASTVGGSRPSVARGHRGPGCPRRTEPPASRVSLWASTVAAISDSDRARVVVAVPDRSDVAPAGPVQAGPVQAGPAQAGWPGPHPGVSKPLADAYDAADVLLVLADPDPAIGAEHLASWAGRAVVMLGAGAEHAARIHAVGEAVRFAGTELVGAVLLGADKADQTLGSAPAPVPARWQRPVSGPLALLP